MNFNKYLTIVLAVLFYLVVCYPACSNAQTLIVTPIATTTPIQFSNGPITVQENPTRILPEQTPVLQMTTEEYENYLKYQQESGNYDSAGKQGMEQQEEDIKNHKVKVHPFHSTYTPEPAPNQPTNFKIVSGNGMASLTWDAMSKAEAYFIYISEDGEAFKKRAVVDAKQGHEIAMGLLENGTTYYFGVSAFGRGGESKKVVVSVVPTINNGSSSLKSH